MGKAAHNDAASWAQITELIRHLGSSNGDGCGHVATASYSRPPPLAARRKERLHAAAPASWDELQTAPDFASRARPVSCLHGSHRSLRDRTRAPLRGRTNFGILSRRETVADLCSESRIHHTSRADSWRASVTESCGNPPKLSSQNTLQTLMVDATTTIDKPRSAIPTASPAPCLPRIIPDAVPACHQRFWTILFDAFRAPLAPMLTTSRAPERAPSRFSPKSASTSHTRRTTLHGTHLTPKAEQWSAKSPCYAEL